MRVKFSFGLFLLIGLTMFASSVSAHWGGGDGHISAAITEWVIILGSLVGTFVLVFRKKPLPDENQSNDPTSLS